MQSLRRLDMAEYTSLSTLAENENHPVVGTARSNLRATGYASVGRVACRFDEGTLILSGNVMSYYEKQIAQTAVMSVDGVECVVNNVKVRSRSR